ncbi:hypothetical protein [Halovulum sp. GXIMD14793]
MAENAKDQQQEAAQQAADYLDLWERNLRLIAVDGTRAVKQPKPE